MKPPTEPDLQADIARFPGTEARTRTTFQHPFLDRDRPRRQRRPTSPPTRAPAPSTPRPPTASTTSPPASATTCPKSSMSTTPAARCSGNTNGHRSQPYEGLTVFKSNKVIIELLREKRRAPRRQPLRALLPPLLALPQPRHRPRHRAVVHRHGNPHEARPQPLVGRRGSIPWIPDLHTMQGHHLPPARPRRDQARSSGTPPGAKSASPT
jgi:hypothetical protein